jgi:S-adenosylmethionine decarboxylase
MTYWGYHLIIDAAKCCPDAIRSSQTIHKFTTTLVNSIDMVAYGEPQIVHFGTGNKAGYTLVQLIETSNICAHFVEETNDMYLDVFSCKQFENADVFRVLNSFFKPRYVRSEFLTRKAPYIQNELSNKKPELR